MAIELPVFRLGEPVLAKVGGVIVSLWPEFRESQEKGLVIFRVGGGGGGGTGVSEVGATGLVFGGDSAFEGDHGIAGSEDAILLRDSFFWGCFCVTSGITGSSAVGISKRIPYTLNVSGMTNPWAARSKDHRRDLHCLEKHVKDVSRSVPSP